MIKMNIYIYKNEFQTFKKIKIKWLPQDLLKKVNDTTLKYIKMGSQIKWML